MKIDVGPGDIEMPQQWDTDKYVRTNICDACGGKCKWGDPHTLLECLTVMRDQIAALNARLGLTPPVDTP